MKINYNYLFIIFLILIQTLIPFSVILFSLNYQLIDFRHNLISNNAFIKGTIILLLFSIILCVFVSFLKKRNTFIVEIYKCRLYLYIICQTFMILLITKALFFPFIDNPNLQNKYIVISGYFLRPFIFITFGFIIYDANIYKKITRLGFFLLISWLIFTVLSKSRSSIIELLFVLYFAFINYKTIRIKFFNILFFILFLLSSVFISNSLRNISIETQLVHILFRLYENVQVLYFAFTDFDHMNRIITYNQPYGIISSMFSFIVHYDHVPSMYRLPEFWGSGLVTNELGGNVGYVFGITGLTFGLLPLSFAFLTIIIFFVFWTKIFNVLTKRISIYRALLIYFWVRLLYEVLNNLGLESLIAKTFKNFIFLLFSLIIVVSIETLFQNKNKIN